MSQHVATFARDKQTKWHVVSRHLPDIFNSPGANVDVVSWRKAAKIVFAIPPTSAASERVFSLLQAMFGKDQDASLSDLIQAALVLRYNKRQVG